MVGGSNSDQYTYLFRSAPSLSMKYNPDFSGSIFFLTLGLTMWFWITIFHAETGDNHEKVHVLKATTAGVLLLRSDPEMVEPDTYSIRNS